MVIENNGTGDDPDDVRYGHRSHQGLCHENADNPGPCHENIVRNVRLTTYDGDGAANILTLIALLRVTSEDNWAKDSF